METITPNVRGSGASFGSLGGICNKATLGKEGDRLDNDERRRPSVCADSAICLNANKSYSCTII